MSLLYYQFLAQHSAVIWMRWLACLLVLVGIGATAGGFFLHMGAGKPGQGSIGILVTNLGAGILALAVLLLVYLMIVA